MATKVVELAGFGRIGEWLDYSGDPEGTFRMVVASPKLLATLQKLEIQLSMGVYLHDPEMRDVMLSSVQAAIAEAV